MIVKEDFLKKLRQAFDLNIYEVKIWTALLSRGIATAGELSDISQVPRSRCYDVLETLEKKNFVIMKLGKPIKYIAVKPGEIVTRMKGSVQDKADTKIDSLENIKTEPVFDEIQLLYTQGIKKIDPNSLAGAIKGRDRVYNHLRSILENAKKSITIMTTEQGLLRKAKRYKGLFAKLHDKGIKIRIAAPISDSVLKQLNDIKNLVQIKKTEDINARFIIVDDTQVLFMVSDDSNTHESYDTGVWVDTPFFTKALSNMFNSTWSNLTSVRGRK